jgi:hypothetical protein
VATQVFFAAIGFCLNNDAIDANAILQAHQAPSQQLTGHLQGGAIKEAAY